MRIRFQGSLQVAVVLLGAWLAGTTASLATTALAQLSIEKLTDLSDVAIHGTIESMEAVKHGDQIFTIIEVDVKEELKGQVSTSAATLMLYGGVYEGIRTRILGAPCITGGEEVVLFLKANGSSTFDIVNLAEGKFQVVRTVSGTRVQRDLSGISYLESTVPEIPTTLDGLKSAIRAAAR